MRFLLLASAIGLLGCDAILGIEVFPRGVFDDASVGDAGAVDTGPQPNTACIACESASCASERTACLGNASCAPLLGCLDTCAVGAVLCRSLCERTHVAGTRTKAFADVDLCRRKSCADTCFGAAGFGAAIDASCGCMDALCADKMLACVQSGVAAASADAGVDSGDAGVGSKEAPGACDRRLACIAEIANPDRYVDCVTDIGGGLEANELLNCMRTKSCAVGAGEQQCSVREGVFACVEKFAYATEKISKVVPEFTFGLQAFDSTPIEGATLIACLPPLCGPGCTQLGSGITKADGKATFEVKVLEGAFDGCIYVPKFGDYMGMSVFTGRRIHRSESMLTSYALQEDLLQPYADQVGKPLKKDGAHGHVLVAIHDCIWGRVAGNSLQPLKGADEFTVLGYLEGLKARADLTATTSTGAAAYLNVPAGTHELVVTRKNSEGKDFVVERQFITVRAGELTDVNIYPLDGNK